MRIAIVVSDLRVGGAERNAVNYATMLAARGHDVALIAGDGPLARQLGGTRIRHIKLRTQLRRPWTLLRTASALRQLTALHGLDIVHAFMASAAAAARLAQLSGATYRIISSPPGATQDPNESRWISHLRLRALVASSDLVLSPSSPFRLLLGSAGLAQTRIRDLDFNAIPLHQYSAQAATADLRRSLGLTPEDLVVCVIARLHPVKRVDMAIRAMPHVLARVAAARLLVVGGGPERDRLAALAHHLKVGAFVRFAGERQDVPAILNISALLVQTTAGVGGPGLTTIEAFAASRPVVCVESGDRRSAIGDSSATIFVPEGDTIGLAAAITELLSDPTRASAMGAAGRAWAEQWFDMDRVVDALESLYRELRRSGSAAE